MKRIVDVKAVVVNEDDCWSFARKINEMPECAKLTEDERAKIIYSYPIVMDYVPTAPKDNARPLCRCEFLSRILDRLGCIHIFS